MQLDSEVKLHYDFKADRISYTAFKHKELLTHFFSFFLLFIIIFLISNCVYKSSIVLSYNFICMVKGTDVKMIMETCRRFRDKRVPLQRSALCICLINTVGHTVVRCCATCE